MQLLSRLHRDQRGLTLMELLIASTVGTVIVMAAFNLAEASMRTSKSVERRADSTQRGRNAMEQMVQSLRSSVCLYTSSTASTLPILAGTPDSVTFVSEIAKPVGTGTDAFQPEQWQLVYDNTARTITEKRWTGTGTYPNITYPATSTTPATTRTVLAGVRRQGTQPVFSYYAYKADGTIDPYGDPAAGVAGDTALGASPSLSATDLPKVAMVRVSFTAGPLGLAGDPKSDATFDEAVRLRLVDPRNFQDGAVCRA